MLQLTAQVDAPAAEVHQVLIEHLTDPALDQVSVRGHRGVPRSEFTVVYHTEDLEAVRSEAMRLVPPFRVRGWPLPVATVATVDAEPVDLPSGPARGWSPRQCMAAGFGAAAGIASATATLTVLLTHVIH